MCDAETDDDLARAVDVLLSRPRPLVVAGSLGLGTALRRHVLPPKGPLGAPRKPVGAGRLIIVGSLHPMAREQARVVAGDGPMYEVDEATPADGIARRAQAALSADGTVVLVTPSEAAPGSERALLASLERVAAACLRRQVPHVLAIVGGETAFGVLRVVEQPLIDVEGTPAPLVVVGSLVGGALDGVSLVTKGGSSGGPDTLRDAVAAVAHAEAG